MYVKLRGNSLGWDSALMIITPAEMLVYFARAEN